MGCLQVWASGKYLAKRDAVIPRVILAFHPFNSHLPHLSIRSTPMLTPPSTQISHFIPVRGMPDERKRGSHHLARLLVGRTDDLAIGPVTQALGDAVAVHRGSHKPSASPSVARAVLDFVKTVT